MKYMKKNIMHKLTKSVLYLMKRRKEVEKEVKVYRPTADILADIEETQNEIIEAFAELKKMLGE